MSLLESPLSVEREDRRDLKARVIRTLELLRDWGQATTPEQLAAGLLGGGVEHDPLLSLLETMDGIVLADGIVGLEGSADLIPKTRGRLATHSALESEYLEVAEEFTEEFLRWCPLAYSVALSGSLSNGGFDEGDDIDFDLIVRPGTRYVAYLLATLVGLRYAWRYRNRELHSVHKTPVLPKITCVNVVWSEDQARPFARQDVNLAYELMRCRPLHGASHFESILRDNLWVSDYFPQLLERRATSQVAPDPNPFGRFLLSLVNAPRLLRVVDGMCRGLSWMIYQFVQWTRRHNPEARARMEYLRRVKYPYEVFQD
ncbi:MAG: hypothetical protein R3291_01390 [Thermoplasmata archaeon]|nr:hypothetical protein [Thermoplasmata archaeon]